MELSPEERKRIYEEEKARIDEERKQEQAKQKAEGLSTTNLDPNVAGLLCYLGIWVTGIIFLVLEQKNKYVRFHAIQSIITFGILGIANVILSQIPIVGWFFVVTIGVLTFIMWIVLMIKAYEGKLYKIPLAGDVAGKASGAELPEDSKGSTQTEQLGISAPPLPQHEADSVKQATRKAEDYSHSSRAGRITSSSFAIAWSIIFLVLFNFFNRYIAYYQYESGEWVRYPVLTADFSTWLPIITATMIISIIGHIIAIGFDKYLVREIILIILNLFGIAAVANLLSIFPFNFDAIPNTDLANILPVITTIALIGIVIGLGIAALVGFIKLIVTTVTGTGHY